MDTSSKVSSSKLQLYCKQLKNIGWVVERKCKHAEAMESQAKEEGHEQDSTDDTGARAQRQDKYSVQIIQQTAGFCSHYILLKDI